MPEEVVEDHYATLQISSNADMDTIQSAYRSQAKELHPDNPETGDAVRFAQLQQAYQVLSDQASKQEYDAHYEPGPESAQTDSEGQEDEELAPGVDKDEEARQSILALLYVARRRDVNKPGLGIVHLEDGLGDEEEFLEFHLWYLKERGWIERLPSGEYAITVSGVDQVTKTMLLRADRLLSDRLDDADRPEAAEKTPSDAPQPEQSTDEEDNWYL